MENSRQCGRCLRTRTTSNFYANPMGRNGLSSICKECCQKERDANKLKKALYDRARRLANPDYDRVRRKAYRDSHLEQSRAKERAYAQTNKTVIRERKRAWAKKNRDRLRHQELHAAYGIGTPEFEFMLAAQGGLCVICRCKPGVESKGVLHVDHDHSTGKVRGLLCSPCNKAIGMLRDKAELADAVAAYLRSHALAGS